MWALMHFLLALRAELTTLKGIDWTSNYPAKKARPDYACVCLGVIQCATGHMGSSISQYLCDLIVLQASILAIIARDCIPEENMPGQLQKCRSSSEPGEGQQAARRQSFSSLLRQPKTPRPHKPPCPAQAPPQRMYRSRSPSNAPVTVVNNSK